MSLTRLTTHPSLRARQLSRSFAHAHTARQCRPASLLQQRLFSDSRSRSDGRLDQHSKPSSQQTTPKQSPTSKEASQNSADSPSSHQTEISPKRAALEEQQTFSTQRPKPSVTNKDAANFSLPAGWEDDPDYDITAFSQLPHQYFGYNQHIKINEDFKDALRQVCWHFRAPIRYAFAYGSGVFGQKSTPSGSAGLGDASLSPHPNPPKAVEDWQKGGAKVIDFIFGVSHTQHFHSLNLTQHPSHYSGLRWLPYSSAAISYIQDNIGAGVYFNPFITVNGIMVKYGVVHLDTLARDLSEWDTLYLAGRLQKPVKILRDDPRIRLANQVNLISALRVALLMLPEEFTERQLYERIAGLSYLGDPRMHKMIASENPDKVANIVGAQLPGFRQLYVPLMLTLPNVDFTDSRTPRELGWEKEDAIRHTGTTPKLDDVLGGADGLTLHQDMDPQKRGNMVRRLPKAFRRRLYYKYKSEFRIPGSAFSDILESATDEDATEVHRREGGPFERRIAEQDDLAEVMAKCVKGTVAWPATSQTVKSFFTAGVGKAWKYYSEKRKRGKETSKKSSDSESVKTDVKSDASSEYSSKTDGSSDKSKKD